MYKTYSFKPPKNVNSVKTLEIILTGKTVVIRETSNTHLTFLDIGRKQAMVHKFTIHYWFTLSNHLYVLVLVYIYIYMLI